MKRSVALTFFGFVMAALAAIGWMATRALSRERFERERQFRAAAEARLDEVAATLAEQMSLMERDLTASLKPIRDSIQAREITRNQPLLRQVFLLDTRGRMIFPSETSGDTSVAEQEFVRRTKTLFRGEEILFEAGKDERSASSSRRRGSDTISALASHADSGWIRRYWDDGPEWLYWIRPAPAGILIGAQLERIAVLSRLCASVNVGGDEDGRIAFQDARGRVIGQWGTGESVTIERVLPVPLDGFRLSYAASKAQQAAFLSKQSYAETLALLGLMAALLVAAAFVWREQTRAFVEARTRVKFVTQVTHELKTPLTNIRLYAELMGYELGEEEQPNGHLAVILSESQRLGRLIDNVLCFSRPPHLHLESVNVNEVIEKVLAQHALSFAQRNIAVFKTLGAGALVKANADALAQILANLLSNVEKYAAAGGYVGVESREEKAAVEVWIRDRGPGIAPADRERVFRAFVRLGGKLCEGVSGTGIGLTISRELAERMGGSLNIADASAGASFVLRLPKVKS